MMAFVCYSRTHFYLAEDLAFALGECGIEAWFDVHRLGPGDDWDAAITAALQASDALVLVASPAAFASPHVRRELELAQALDKPAVVALADRVSLPPALANAPYVDLRKGLEKQVWPLAAALDDDDISAPPAAGALRSRTRPGVVRAVSAILLGAALLCEATVALVVLIAPATHGRAPLLGTIYGVFGAAAAWLWWVFSHRRPGWTIALAYALVVCVATAAGVFGVLVYVFAVRAGHPDPAGAIVLSVLLGVLALPLFVAVWAMRSPSFYRWLPTGDAPRWMRRRMLARQGRRRPAERITAGTASVTYAISCDALDCQVQRALESVLQAAGHRRVGSDDAERLIVVLSNLTPIGVLPAMLARRGPPPVFVIAAPISLAAVDYIERYQWVDYRRRNRRTLDRLARSIGAAPTAASTELVPEGLSRRVLPVGVLVLCASYALSAAAALGAGLAGLAGADIAEIYGAAPSLLRSLVALFLGLLSLWIATVLVTRRLPLRYFFPAGVGIAIGGFETPLAGAHAPALVVAVAVIEILGGLFICGRVLPGWLPPRIVRGGTPRLGAVSPAWWRRGETRGVVLVTLAWTLVVLTAVPALAPNFDERQIRATLAAYALALDQRDYATVCSRFFAPEVLAQAQATVASCTTALETNDPGVGSPKLTVSNVDVSGATGAAAVHISASDQSPRDRTIQLAKVDGLWRVLTP